jgi:hypothetical protein
MKSARAGCKHSFGLSRKAIERWVTTNSVDPSSPIITLVESPSSKLFFLANKSQEQVSEEYKSTASEIAAIAKAIESEVEKVPIEVVVSSVVPAR